MHIPTTPPDLTQVMARELSSREGLAKLQAITALGLGPSPGAWYRHWDTFRQSPPVAEYSPELQWLVVKMARRALARAFPLRDAKGQPFTFALPNPALEYLHRVDRDATGAIKGADLVTNPATRDRYLFTSLVEEAITSSQLEGASTTRLVAKAMIQEGRTPRDRSERMIFNNYSAMRLVRELKGSPLTPAIVFDIQKAVTAGTLDVEDGAGRFRRDDEQIVVSDPLDGKVLHTPPPARELEGRLKAMCDFANGLGDGEFIPPPVRAILLHFWLAYDHPFVDGNGRTARALFYWCMAREGYWLCEYISISRILREARSSYSRAFLYAETDENDATYFLLYQLRVLCRAIDALHEYLAKKAAELHRTAELVRRARAIRGDLNARQLALIHHALEHPDAHYTGDSHARSHGVTYETARQDLLMLVGRKLLMKERVGRQHRFRPAPDLRQRMEDRVRAE